MVLIAFFLKKSIYLYCVIKYEKHEIEIILLLINLGLATSIFSQSLLYLYDAAGNRITRMQVATRSFVLQKTR